MSIDLIGNIWTTDTSGMQIKGGCEIHGREGSSEVFELEHGVSRPFDPQNGCTTGNRTHRPLGVTISHKDPSVPYYNKACCTGETLPEIKIKLYTVDDSGQEVPYYVYTLTNSKVIDAMPALNSANENAVQMMQVAFSYQKIKWEYLDGNIAYEDTWLVR